MRTRLEHTFVIIHGNILFEYCFMCSEYMFVGIDVITNRSNEFSSGDTVEIVIPLQMLIEKNIIQRTITWNIRNLMRFVEAIYTCGENKNIFFISEEKMKWENLTNQFE